MQKEKKKRMNKRMLFVRVVSVVLVALIALSALSVVMFL